jgi:hypothetical protein
MGREGEAGGAIAKQLCGGRRAVCRETRETGGEWPAELRDANPHAVRELHLSFAVWMEEPMIASTRWLALPAVLAACTAAADAQAGRPAPQGQACTREARPAITVEPVDRRTGQPVPGPILLVVQDGDYRDTARLAAGQKGVSAAYERAGTYTVTVRHDGYRPWQRRNVRVSRDECHVQTVRLRAELQPVARE